MGTCTGSSIHITGYCITGNIAKVTQILESFGISFTNYICRFIPVKYPDQLPWISVLVSIRIRDCLIIIICQITDHFFICSQLLRLRHVFKFINDHLCIGSCFLCSLYHTGIYPILLSCIFADHRHGNCYIWNLCDSFSAPDRYGITVIPLCHCSLFIPV